MLFVRHPRSSHVVHALCLGASSMPVPLDLVIYPCVIAALPSSLTVSNCCPKLEHNLNWRGNENGSTKINITTNHGRRATRAQTKHGPVMGMGKDGDREEKNNYGTFVAGVTIRMKTK